MRLLGLLLQFDLKIFEALGVVADLLNLRGGVVALSTSIFVPIVGALDDHSSAALLLGEQLVQPSMPLARQLSKLELQLSVSFGLVL